MQYTKLGNSDLNVSRICMGCMGFGDAANGQHSWTIDEEHSREIIRREKQGILAFPTVLHGSLRRRTHWQKERAVQSLFLFRGITT